MTSGKRSRLVVLISGSGSNLQAFIDASQDGSLNADIVGVISNKAGVLGLQRAQDAGIPSEVLDHRAFPSRESFDAELGERVSSYQPDLVILAGFMRILTPKFVNRFAGHIMNIHPSLLPKYPGLHTHQRAIDAGDKKGGATVHFVTSDLDGGPAIIQTVVPIINDDTADLLASRVLEQEHQIYPLAARWFCEGRLILENGVSLLSGNALPETGFPFSNATTEQ